jgi:pimeloyl-ACP methyl ester carboxylesterase
MPYCKVSKAELYYEEFGAGKPIIMIHGYSPDHRLMTGCMEPIFNTREGWRRIYIDLPGMGLYSGSRVREASNVCKLCWCC